MYNYIFVIFRKFLIQFVLLTSFYTHYITLICFEVNNNFTQLYTYKLEIFEYVTF